MSRAWSDLQEQFGLREWWTSDNWPCERNDLLPHRFVHERSGAEELRFGGFMGWDSYHPRHGIGTDDLPSADELVRKNFQIVEHQTSGTGCCPWTGIVMPISVNPEIIASIADLCRHYFFSDMHCVPKHGIREYQTRLRDIGLTAAHLDHSDWGFSEGVYPLDPTSKNFATFSAEPIELAKTDEFIKALGPRARKHIRIFILADNSD